MILIFFRIKCFEKDETFDSRSIFAIEVHSKKVMQGLAIHICTRNLQDCCTTTSFGYVEQNTSKLLDGQRLRNCEGFQIIDNKYIIHLKGPLLDYPESVSKYLHSVSLYSSRFKKIAPMHTCDPDFFGHCTVKLHSSQI